ncbi:MAG: methyltransferase domain-containing protein [Candidatus Woesearchaeota archaeon]
MKNKLNLGSGRDIIPGYVNLDCAKLPGIDVVWGLEKFPYPFKDDTFEEVICNHVLEHLSDLCRVMEELHRICKNKALIKIRVPYFANPEHDNDPTHKRKFTYNTFEYFTDNSGFSYYSKARFNILKRRILFAGWGLNL